MSNEPTPRTDEQINGRPCTQFAIMAGDSLSDALVKSEFARQLERELTEVTKDRDKLAQMIGAIAMIMNAKSLNGVELKQTP